MAKQKCGAYRRGDTRPARGYALPGVDINKDDILVVDDTNEHYVRPMSGLVAARGTEVAGFVGIAMHGVKASDAQRSIEIATEGDFMYGLKAPAQLNLGDLLTISDDGTNLVNQEVVKTATASEALFVVVSTTGVPDFDWNDPKSAILASDLDTKDEVEGRILKANGVLGVDLA